MPPGEQRLLRSRDRRRSGERRPDSECL